MSELRKGWIAVLVLVSPALGFVCLDCCMGERHYHECRVLDHHYVAPYTTFYTSTDSDGNSTLESTHHPEEFHVICQRYDDEVLFDCSEFRAEYYAVTNGQQVTVRTRQGRWTSHQYLPRIEPP